MQPSSSSKKNRQSGREHVARNLQEMSAWKEANTAFANHGQTYPFSKSGPQIDVMTSCIKAEISESVGLILVFGKKRIGRGTGFRVGNKYIMTCLHVVKDIIEDDCRINCDSQKIQIQFGMVDHYPTTVFHFEPTLCQHKDFDLAILELKHEVGKSFPRQLILSRSLDLSLPVHLIGHPGGVEMKEDSGVNLYDIQPGNDVDKYINKLSQWSQIDLPWKIDYYETLRNLPRKILFSTTFDEGSSGAPGIMIQHHKPYVIVMVSGGVPDCHYKNIRLVQHDERIEFGYVMEDIYKEMTRSTDENIRKMAAEIFLNAY